MNNKYDVIVIGGGMGGLVSAGLLAKQGKQVLLLERDTKVGGYVSGFMRDDFYFDAACAFVSACSPGAEFYNILTELGVIDDLTFLPINTIWNIYPDFDLRINYEDPAAYLEGVKNRFPEMGNAIDAYGALTAELGKEFVDFEQAPWWKKLVLPFSFPTLFRYVRKSHADILHKFFNSHPHMTLALSALPTSLPPRELSYAFVAVLWAKVLKSGVCYPKGGMKALSEALAQGIKRHGVKIACDQEVTRVITQGRKAIGVGLSDGSEIYSDWIIASCNPFQMQRMLPSGLSLYRGMYRLARFKSSLSAVLFYIKLKREDLPPDWPYFVSINTSNDLEEMSAALESGSMEKGLHIVITAPSLLDPSLAPRGHHSLKVLVHAPRVDLFEKIYGTDESFEQLQNRVFSEIRAFSGLDLLSHALSVEHATPGTLFRRTGNEGGAMYGLDAACGQVGPQRPPNRTALKNLLCAGHYTHPAHGIVGSAMSGSFASKIILSK
jgi:phytoene dehydrogenase-like protein